VQDLKRRVIQRVGVWWIAGCLSEAAWQILFAQNNKVTMVLCVIVLVTGALAFEKALWNAYALQDELDRTLKVLVAASSAINAAWLTVASSVGILVAVVANAHSLPSLDTVLEMIAVVLAVLVTVLGAAIIYLQGNVAYGSTLIWAFFGVYSKTDSQAVQYTALSAIVSSAALVLGSISRHMILARSDK
jgi:hypothetical protein